ncbi:hypothetical protein [Mangrovicoccus ximenensis]|uniref:hypothetical protein n=1 Tax=Mangrovicoccus ximenensis TaxID=1911570 RepID=UPI0011AE2A42|nr:hypothetical protein [Mangrovicoccus ximenensis]
MNSMNHPGKMPPRTEQGGEDSPAASCGCGAGSSAASRAVIGLGAPTTEFMAKPLRIGGARPFQWAPVARSASIIIGPLVTLDLSHLVDGTDVTVLAQPGARIIAGQGRPFLGTGQTMATVKTGQALRIMRIGPAVILQPVTRGDLAYGSADVLTHDVRFVCGGQSNMSLMEDRGGWGGFSSAVARGLSGSRNMSVHFVNGATGGTPLDLRSAGPGAGPHWWDAGAGQPGPALETFLEKLAEALRDGQDIPMRCFWTQGESDSMALHNRRIATDDYVETILAVWDHIWERHPELEIFANLIGGTDYLVAERGTNAVRAAYLRAIAQRPRARQGIEMYDLPRDWQDVHYQYGGYAMAGGRMAAHLLNFDHGADNALGPQVTGASLQPDGKSVLLQIDWGGSPVCPPQQAVLADRRPYGIYLLPPGADPADDPIDAVDARFEGGNLLLRSRHDLAGCRVGGPYGCCTEARRGHVLHDLTVNNFNGDRGLPLRSFLTDIA